MVMYIMSNMKIQNISKGVDTETIGLLSAHSLSIARDAKINPKKLLPASPKNILAGLFDLKLYGKNPMQLPIMAIAIHPRKGWFV